MKSGYTLPLSWSSTTRLLTISLWSALFFSIFSVPLAAENSLSEEMHVLPEGEETCAEENSLLDEFSPPDYFVTPAEGKRVDLIYRGLKLLLPARVDIPNPENVEKVYIEVVYKGNLPGRSLHSAIQARLEDGSEVTLTPKLVKGDWGSSDGVGVFYAEVGKTNRVQLDFEVSEGSAQSVMLYVLRNEQIPGIYQAGTYANFFGHRTTAEFDIPLTPDPRRKDVRITIPITEITTDGRGLDFEITAGSLVKRFHRTWNQGFNFDNQCCIDSVETILRGVGAVDKINIKVTSPDVNGQSFVLSGIIQAELCPVCDPIDLQLPGDICTDNTVVIRSTSPGAGYSAEWDFGPGAHPRTYTGFGEVFIMFSESRTNQEIKVNVTSPTCVSQEVHYVEVQECNRSECALEGATVIQNPANGNANGIIELDMCVSCGSTPPYRVFYTYQGQQVEKGPIDQARPRLTNLLEGTYSQIYVIDAKGCQTNITGPVTLCNGGCGNEPTCSEQVCTLTGFNDRGRKRTIWLPTIGFTDPRWRWEDGTGNFIVTGPNSARVEGRIVSIEDPTCGFEVNFVFASRRNWNQWSALGRGWKGSRDRIVDNQHTTWDYYEMVAGQSTLKGFGCWTGTLTLSPRPADFSYGVQVGEGANDQNLSPGLSAWFAYEGDLNGLHYSGEGDINDEGTCRLTDLTRNAVPIISCAADFAVSCGGSPDDAPRPEINCGNPDDYTLTYEDREVSASPRRIERTWTAAGPDGPATCKQMLTFGDENPPVFTQVPTEDRMLCGEVIPQQATATDDCGTATVTFRETKFNESCPGTYDLRRVWTATDESGNTATAELIVHVIDEEGPVFQSKPLSVVIDCTDELPTDQPVAVDACGGNVDLDYSITDCEARNPVYTWDQGILNYLTEGIDPCDPYPNNMQRLLMEAVCSDDPSVRRRWRVVNRNDFPVWMTRVEAYGRDIYNDGFSIPAGGDIFLFTPTEAGDKSITITWNDHNHQPTTETGLTSEDQCELSQGETCACAVKRQWKATDECGNTSWYTQLVWKRDTDAPTLRNLPADRTYSAGTTIPAPGNVTATDACGNPSVVFNEERVESADYNCDDAAVHYFFGWKEVHTALLFINGRQYSFADTPLRIQENCEGTAVVAGSLVDLANSNAGFDLVWNLKDRRSYAEHSAAGGTSNTACSSPDKNNWSFYQFEVNSRFVGTGSNAGVTLELSSPSNSWVQLGAGANGVNCKLGIGGDFNYTQVAGNYGGNYGFICGSLSSVAFEDTGSCVASYTLIRSWMATDQCGNQAFERQVIRVLDEENPTFEGVPNNLTIDCSDAIPTATVTAIDNADTDVEITLAETDTGDLCGRTITRTWTAVDDCGNSKTARQVITVRDQVAPEITFNNPAIQALNSGDILVISCSDVPTIDESIAAVTDNCDPNPTLTFRDEGLGQGDCDTDGYRERFRCTWTAKDQCGNETVFFLFVEFHDDLAPVFAQVPANKTQACDEAIPTDQPTASDNCSVTPTIQETQSTIPGACADAYQIVRLWTATDDCGNTATASQVITLTDDTSPVLADIPAAITLSCEDALPTNEPTATDNCDQSVRLVETQETQPGACAESYILVRLWTATDNCGNTATASQLVTVQDTQAPTLAFSNTRLNGLSDGAELLVECDAIPIFGQSDVIVNDNCDTDVNVTFTDNLVAEGDCAADGFVKQFRCTWTALDACGNASSISINLKVLDNSIPTIENVPGDISISCEQSLPTSQPTISDNCTSTADLTVVETSTTEPGTCAEAYNVIRLWTATDACGNVATASQTVSVSDEIRPIMAQVPESLTISCSDPMPTTLPTATDNCDSDVTITVEENRTGADCPGNASVVRVFTATDNCGNTATASQVVTIRDREAPSFSQVPESITLSCTEALPTTQPVAADNCDSDVNVVETSQRRDGTCPDSYELVRLWTATDNCGNTVTTSQVITIQDNEAPVLASLPQNMSIRCDEPLPTNRPTATDNCDTDVNIAETQETRPGACENSYEIIRLFTATDNCGNVATGSQVVTVTDDIKPTFSSVPANITIDCDGVIPQEQPAATDNCDGPVAVVETQETQPTNCAGAYTLIRMFTAVDKCGNEATASQIVTVQDIDAPVFAYVPANLAISCAEALPVEEAQASDNCDQDVIITERQETRAGACAGTYDVVRFFTATDDCGNTASASQVVSVFDDQAPTFAGIPTNVSISCDATVPTDAPTASDNCDSNVDVQLTETREDGTCADSYRIIRHWVATDHCGNAATASQVVTVQDQTIPEFVSVPENMTISCSQSLPTTQATATDNCDSEVTIDETQRTEAGACTNTYKVIRIWTAMDNCGNTATASQVIQVEDTEAPSFANVPAAVSINCDDPLPSIGPDVTDNCDDEVSLNETQETRPGACPESYEIVRTWTATDNCGNVETASQVVTVTDSEAPTFAFVPATVTIDCDASLPSSQPEVEDNCDLAVQVTERQETQAGNCGGAYTVVRIWTAVDNCGNQSSASQIVNVQDVSAPTFASVPQATTIQCDDAVPVTQPIVTDNCDDNVTVTEAQNNEAGACPGTYTLVRIWTAEDDCGNTSTAEQRVTVEDTEAPVFTQVPASITLGCEDNVPTVLAEATDNCDDNVTVTETQDRVEGNCPGNFTVTRLFTATDHCGNVATATQVIVFQDNTDPVFADVPATVTIECDGALPTNAPTATDNCDQNVMIAETQENQPGACADSYRVIRLWTATDNCGNTSTASQIVNVEDTQAPTFANVPATVTVECSDALPTDMATATDNCDDDVAVTVAERNEPGNCADNYTVIRVFTAVDNCGNTATAEQRVNVVDTQAPTFASVPQAVTISCDEAIPTTTATATDNCDAQVTVTETERTVQGDCTDSYSVIRLFTATDNCGNTATAEQTVTIQDTQAPTFANIPQPVTISCDEALPTSAPVASDNCDTQVNVTEAQRTEPGDCSENSFVIRTWTAVDNCGNTATAEQRITLIDEVAPVLVSVPVGVTIACDQELPTDLPVATDNCDDEVNITEMQVTVPGDCPGAYDVIRTFTATDGCGNTATASQLVKVIDNRNPVFENVPTAVTISCDEQLPTNQPTATDTCDDNVDIEESEEFLAGACGGSYRVIRQWTATDDCGNTATATQLVTVQDLVAPVFASIPEAVSLTCDEAIPTDVPVATDNCDDDVHISETQQRMPGGCADSYTLVRTFTATDECGNTASASQVVTVIDDASPEFVSVPSDVIISCDEQLPTDQPTATDSCDEDVSITEAQETIQGACPGAYTLIRTWTAVDNCGNTATASQTVEVGDRAEPTFTNVPAAVTISCDGEVPTDQPSAIDNCDDNVLITEVQTTETGDCTDSYKVIRTWTAADDCGNVATASQVVTIEDNTAPTFVSIPPAVTIGCDQALPTTQPRANDNCDMEVTITERTDRDRGDCADNSTITRIWTATDNCGNTATAAQLVTIQDNTPPVFANVPASVTILCDESAPDSEPTATDNCDDEVRIRSNEERIDGNCADSYQLVRTWTAEDDCGNTATATQVVTVIDPTAPTFTQIPPETTITCNESLPTSQPVTNDNCDNAVTITETQETLPGACPDSYVVIRTWVITDNCGNSDRATQKVTVIDTSVPTFASVPASRTINCDEDPGDEEPVATDNCDEDVAITMTETTNGDNCAEGIELIRIWTATDNCGNTATASQTITFVDEQAPVLAGLDRSITVECDQPVPLIYPTATDNCDRDVDILYFDNEQDAPCGKTITRTWVASDDCGNTASATQLIIVTDSQIPVLNGVPSSAQINCDDAIPTAIVTASDNCTTDPLIAFEEFEIPGGCPGELSIIRVWTATDDCGNAATASQVITITDGGVPVFGTVPAAISISCADELPTDIPTATDNCGGGNTAVEVTVVENNEPGNCANNYRVIRVFTATDDCGNTATASQTVTVSDDEAPVFSSVPADVNLTCSDQLPVETANATDNCDNNVKVSMTERTVAGNCDDSYDIIRTFTAVDACGNAATATQTITVTDDQAPTFANVPPSQEVGCNDPIPSGTPTATDDCDDDVAISVVEERVAGSTLNEYQLIRTWTALDNCGNTATASQVISVFAAGEPRFTFVPENIRLSCTESIPNADARATDNCDGDLQVVLSETRIDGNCANNYNLVRTWTATDADGNSATASQTITISDITAPSFDQVPSDVTLVCGESVPADMATASDLCDPAVIVTVTETNRPGNCGSEFDILRTFRATDACGNATTATQVVSFIDDQAPEFTFVPDSEEFQCSIGQPRERAQATDNCTSNVQITFEDNSPSSDCSQRLQRVWTATDECGNTATAVQQILLEDTEDPVLINVPANASIDLNNGGTIPAPASVTANDNCDSNPDINYTQTTQATTGCGYILVRTWEAVDQCGNSERATQRITVTNDAGVSIIVDPSSDCAPTGIQVHAVPATQGATYTWTSNSGSFTNGNTANPTFIPAGSGTYTIDLTVSGSSCSGTATETITIDGSTLNVTGNGPVCVGSTIELTASAGAASYAWSGPNGFSASQANVTLPNATVAMGGVYTLTADFGSCTQDATVTVNVSGSLQIVLDIPTSICPAQTVTFSANGADNATWTSPSGQTFIGSSTQVGPINFEDYNGQWTVESTNAAGCTTTQTFQVVVDTDCDPNGCNLPEQSAFSVVQPDCGQSNGSITFAGDTTGYVFTWTANVGSGRQASGLAAGSYELNVIKRGDAACAKTYDFVLNEDDAPSVTVDVEGMQCSEAGSVTINPIPTGNYTVLWSDQSTSTNDLVRTDLSAGSYSFVLTAANGCTLTQTVVVPNECECSARVSIIRAQETDVCLVGNEAEIGVVLVTPPVIPANYGQSYLLAEVGTSEVVRTNQTGEFIVNGSSSFSIHQLVYDSVNIPSALVVAGNTIQEIEALFIQGGGKFCGALTTFGARITTAQCCIIPEITSTSTTDAGCGQQNGTANVQVAGNVADFAYVWTPNVGTPLSPSGNLRGGLPVGTYQVRIENRADANCFTETTLNVGASDINAGLPDITPATCGDDNGVVSFRNAAPGLSFTWNDGVTRPSRDDLEAGVYTVTISNGQPNCEETITLTVGAVANFGLTAIVNNEPACGASDGAVTIDASGGSGNFSYDWGAGATRTDLEAGLYTVRVTDQVTNCVDSVTFTLTEIAQGQVRITISDVELRCNGAMDGSPVFTLDYDTDFRFPPRISFVDSQGEVVTFGELGPGSYCMQIRDADDCLAGTGCFEVTQPAGLLVNVTAIAAGCDDDGSITLDISGGTAPYSYDWAHLPAANDPRDLTGLGQGQYTVFITDANGCASTVNNINIGRNCGCSPTLPEITPFPGDVCLTDAQVQLGTQVVSTSTDPGVETAYLLVDADGIILQTANRPEFWVTATGNYTIHGIVYNPNIYNLSAITTGTTSISGLNTQFVQGGGFLCVGLDLDGTPVNVDECVNCTAQVGVLSTNSPVIWCTDDGLPSIVVFDLTASVGRVTYVLVDDAGVVLTIASFNEINFEGQPAGRYTVYAVATEGINNLPLPGSTLLPASGCIDISQGIEVTALNGIDCSNPCQVSAGAIATVTPSTICVDDLPTSLAITASGQTGSERAYIVTDVNGRIVSVQAFDGSLELGTVAISQYRIYVVVYENPITGLETGRSIGNLGGCFDLSNPSTITVASGIACGQSTVTDTVRATIPTTTVDTICFVLDPGFNPATTTYMLVGGTGSTGQSAFGQWTLLPNGCIVYEAGNTPGIDVDNITVIATDGGITDTTIFVITISNNANTVETVNVNVQANGTETSCPVRIPANFSNATATLSTGGTSGSSSFGNFTVDAATGCLTYNAAGTSGAFIDTVIVLVCDATLLDCHEVTYVITVLPQGQTIVRDVDQGDTLVLCPLTNLLTGTAQTPTICTQPSQGTVTLDAATGCFIYTAPTNYAGPDEVCIEVCDDQGICVQLIVQVNVLPACGDLVSDTNVGLNVADCDAFAEYCLPIANADIGDFALVLDGQPFRNTTVACNNGLGTVVNVDTGAHVLEILEIATGCRDTVSILVGCADCEFNRTPAVIDLTDCDDTALIELSLLEGNWPLYEFILDGVDAAAAGNLRAVGTITQLVIDTGLHQLIVRAIDNSCQEVIDVLVRCENNGGGVVPTTGDTIILRDIRVSFSDTICLDDLNLSQTGLVLTLTDICPGAGNGGEVNIEFDLTTQCFVYTGLLPGLDTLCLRACTADGCDTFGLVVNVLPPTTSTVDVNLLVGETEIFCIDTTEIASPITEVLNACAPNSGTAVEFTLDEDTYCVTYTGLAVGSEQGCFVICNDIVCDTVFFNVTVSQGNSNLPPVAVDDRDMTNRNTPVDINILRNDTLNGPLVQLFPLTLPANGNLFIVSDSIIRYTPFPDFCGKVDSFQYVIGNGIGFDTATVRIDVACDDLIIFSGFSPNGDGVNDFFRILGIQEFPENKVLIFNRWGNEVFNVEGYDNSENKSFKGMWGNKTLPDGTYFYVIDLGGEDGCRSGYLQIMR